MATNSTCSSCSSPVLTGRRVLYTNVSVVTKSNVMEVLKSVLPDFFENKREIDYLYNYYKGDQPILQRKKKVRPEICNKVVENHASEIVSFKRAYDFGEPVQYIRRATKNGTDLKKEPLNDEKEDNEISKTITLINEYMNECDKFTDDMTLSEWFFATGTGYRMIMPIAAEENECPFEIDVLDPRYTGVVYNRGFGKKPVMAFQEVQTEKEKVLYAVYTPKYFFEIEANTPVATAGSNEIPTDFALTSYKGKKNRNTLGYIPIIEYPANNNRIGAFELVMSLLDQINNVESNRVDGIEQFIQSFMKFVNVQLDEQQIAQLQEMGAISFKSTPDQKADIDIVTAELDQQQTQITTDHLYQMVLIICGMPDRNGASKSSGDTGQAVVLRDGWTSAESKSKEIQAMFTKSEKRFLEIVLHILKVNNEQITIKKSDIAVKFIPNKTDNILTKTQSMQGMLESGIHPEIAIQKSGLFGDPEQVYVDSKEYMRVKWKTQAEKQEDETRESEKKEKENSLIEPKQGIIPMNNKPDPKDIKK